MREHSNAEILCCLDRAALMWNGTLAIAGKSPKHPVNAHDVAQMMVSFEQAAVYSGLTSLAGVDWPTVAGEAASRLNSEAS